MPAHPTWHRRPLGRRSSHAALPRVGCTYHLRRARSATNRVRVTMVPLASSLRNPQTSIVPLRAQRGGQRALISCPVGVLICVQVVEKETVTSSRSHQVGPQMCSFSECAFIKRKEAEGETKGFGARR